MVTAQAAGGYSGPRFFLTHRKATINAGLALLVVWLLEASWRATVLLHGKMDTGMDWLMLRNVLRSAETAVVVRCLDWCLDLETRHGMDHTPAFQEQIKMSELLGKRWKTSNRVHIGF